MSGEHLGAMRKFSGSAVAALCLAASAAAAGVDDETPRSQFGIAAATALEQAIVRVHPGAQVLWQEPLQLRLSDGSRVEVSLPGFQQRPTATGFTFSTGLEFPEQKKRLLDELGGT